MMIIRTVLYQDSSRVIDNEKKEKTIHVELSIRLIYFIPKNTNLMFLMFFIHLSYQVYYFLIYSFALIYYIYRILKLHDF